MSCSQCQLRRAKLLCETRQAMNDFDIDSIMLEMDYRWPGRFFVRVDSIDSSTIMQRNTVAPYTPNEVYHYVNPTGNA